MSDTEAKKIALASLELTAACDMAGLGALMDDNIVMRFPFSPEGFPNFCEGKEQCLAMTTGIFSAIKSFEWIDLTAYATDEPGVVFLTARSKVETKGGKPYANQYCFKIVVKNGKILEHNEFFNPAPIIKAFM